MSEVGQIAAYALGFALSCVLIWLAVCINPAFAPLAFSAWLFSVALTAFSMLED